MSNQDDRLSPAQVEMIRREVGRIREAALRAKPKLSTLLEVVVEMRLAGEDAFHEQDVMRTLHSRMLHTSSERDNLSRLRALVTQFYSEVPERSDVMVVFDSRDHPFVPRFQLGHPDPKPAYRAALILGEQRAKPGILEAIDQLLALREREHGVTAWGAVGLADMYSRKAILISAVKDARDDLALAHKYADEAIRLMPSATSYVKKGLLYTDDGEVGEAERCFAKAMTLGGDETRLSPEYATFLTVKGNYDEAIACAIDAIGRDHERRTHCINLGEIYYIAGMLPQAREHLQRTEREYPDAWMAAALQGLIAVSEQDWRAGMRHFDRARGLPRVGHRLQSVLHLASFLVDALGGRRAVRSPQRRMQVPGIQLIEYAVFYVVGRRYEECLSVLETLAGYGYPAMSLMIQWPVFAPLHSEQRFQALRRRWQPLWQPGPTPQVVASGANVRLGV